MNERLSPYFSELGICCMISLVRGRFCDSQRAWQRKRSWGLPLLHLLIECEVLPLSAASVSEATWELWRPVRPAWKQRTTEKKVMKGFSFQNCTCLSSFSVVKWRAAKNSCWVPCGKEKEYDDRYAPARPAWTRNRPLNWDSSLLATPEGSVR